MRDGLLGLGKAGGDGAAHAVELDLLVVAALVHLRDLLGAHARGHGRPGGFGRGFGRLGGGGGCRLGGGALHIRLDDASMGAGALDLAEVETLVPGDAARKRGRRKRGCHPMRRARQVWVSRRLRPQGPAASEPPSEAASAPASAAFGASGAGSDGAAMSSALSPSSRRTAMGALTFTPSVPSSTRIFPITPSSTASNSIVALSVSISARMSPALTVSPSLTSHLASVPSSMVGLSAGIKDFGGHSRGSPLSPALRGAGSSVIWSKGARGRAPEFQRFNGADELRRLRLDPFIGRLVRHAGLLPMLGRQERLGDQRDDLRPADLEAEAIGLLPLVLAPARASPALSIGHGMHRLDHLFHRGQARAFSRLAA